MNKDQASGSVLLLFSLFLIYQSRYIESSPGIIGAGPEFFPTLLGGALAPMSVILIVKSSIARSTASWRSILPVKGRRRHLLVLVAGMVIYPLLLDPLGYLITSSVVGTFMLWGIDRSKGWKLAIGIPAATAFACYGIISLVLGLELPPGSLFGLLSTG